MSVPFDRVSYEQNNMLGIVTALNMLNQYGYTTIENGTIERYRERDCLVRKHNRNIPVEVERKLVWKRRDDWEGYSSVRVPYRKHHSKAEFYIMINEPSTCLLICKMEDVKSSPTTLYTTKKYNIEEKFFAVPINKFDVYVLKNNKWEIKHSNVKIIN